MILDYFKRFNKAVSMAVVFSLGILIGYFFNVPIFVVFILSFIFFGIAVIFFRNVFSDISLYILICLVGLLIYKNSQVKPANHIANFAKDNYQDVILKCTIANNPTTKVTRFGTNTSFIAKAQELYLNRNIIKVNGLVLVNIINSADRYEYGDRIIADGGLYGPQLPRNPGGFDYNRFLASNFIYAVLKVDKFNSVMFIAKPTRGQILKYVFLIKNKFRQAFFDNFLGLEEAFLNAIILGERSELDYDIKDAFVKTGTMHIIAISGLHVVFVAALLLFIFKRMFIAKGVSNILTIFILIFYCILVGAMPSVVRATIMACIVLLGWVIAKETNIMATLGVSFIIILLINPLWLFDAGCQLSFISVLSIILFSPKLDSLLKLNRLDTKNNLSNKILFYIGKCITISIAATLGVLPIVAYYFNIVSAMSVFINLIAVPISSFIIADGLLFLALGQLPIVSHILVRLAGWAIGFLTDIVVKASHIPMGWFYVKTPTILEIIIYYLVILSIFNIKRLNLSIRKVFIIFLVILNIFIWKDNLFAKVDTNLKITFLDVGDGDSIFVECPDGKNLLIDAGEGEGKDMGRFVLRPFLLKKGIRKIDAILLTHPDSDHVGGFARVLKDFKVGYAFDSGQPQDSNSYRCYRRLIKDEGICHVILRDGLGIVGYKDVKFYILNPADKFITNTKSDTNNNSIVVRIVYKNISVLLCADIQKEGITKLLSYGPFLNSTVLKVPHHGKDKDEAVSLLFNAVKPSVAVISDEDYNKKRYGNSNWYDRFNVFIYRTSRRGAILFTSDGNAYDIETAMPKRP